VSSPLVLGGDRFAFGSVPFINMLFTLLLLSLLTIYHHLLTCIFSLSGMGKF
jgi:hypothetical protein